MDSSLVVSGGVDVYSFFFSLSFFRVDGFFAQKTVCSDQGQLDLSDVTVLNERMYSRCEFAFFSLTEDLCA